MAGFEGDPKLVEFREIVSLGATGRPLSRFGYA